MPSAVRYYRLDRAGQPAWARQDGERLRLLTDAPFRPHQERDDECPLADARLLPPAVPSKIVCVGLNYADHAAERGKTPPREPTLFLKPPSALIGPDESIRRPSWVGRVDHEAEMGIVIGRAVHELAAPEDARDAIFGCLCVNDVTARELQDRETQYTRAKGFDTFCPLGPCIATGLDLSNLRVEGRVNGEVRQRSTTAQLLFSPEYLVFYVSRVMTLLPGDIISTGTPAGIGPLEAGDVVEVEVEGVGILRNQVL